MKQHWFISLFACLLLTNCQSDYQTLLLDEVKPLQATLLFEKDSNNYIYEIKATDTHLAILNQENDTKLTVYEKGKYDSPVFVVEPATYQEAILRKPHFRKEVTTDKVILLADNNSRFYRFSPENTNWQLQPEDPLFDVCNSFQYNRIQKEIYAVPFRPDLPYPFYYYNTSEGYYWVEADTCVHRQLAYKPDCYLCELCVHEKKNRAAIAYRFTNYVTFYDLEGNIETNIRIGQERIYPQLKETGALDTENTTKCLLDVCGTPDHLYCLYSESADYATPAYLIDKYTHENDKANANLYYGRLCLLCLPCRIKREATVYQNGKERIPEKRKHLY